MLDHVAAKGLSMTIMAGGGLSPKTLPAFFDKVGSDYDLGKALEIHGSFKSTRRSTSCGYYWNAGSSTEEFGEWWVSDKAQVKQAVDMIRDHQGR